MFKCLIVSMFIFCGINTANAQMSFFQTELLAQLHCPNDTVVWLDMTKQRYYESRQKKYGRGRNGLFACRKEVRRFKHTYRRSRLGF